MATVTLNLDGTAAPEPDPVALLPRRLRLSRPAVERLAERTAAPLPWDDRPEPSRTARALGPEAGPPGETPGDGDPDSELLGARVLTSAGEVHPEVAEALAVFGAPEVLVDVDVSVLRAGAPGGFAQVHSWQRLRAGRVTTLAGAGGTLELAWFDDDLWQVELARAVTVTRPRSQARPPARVLDLPHELLLGSGEALRLHREDVFGELVARHTGSVFADQGEIPLGRAGTDEQVRLLNASVLGRMRTVVSGVGDTGARKIGWVSWLLFGDGWRALTPYTLGHEPRVRIHPVEPLRLGVEVARLVTGVRA
ncbi:MAG: hypothetical protein JWN22_3716 [Nocardioides sp.]|jgi:hypothetical protein|nr:hypothetical protein [Nocardioides sp.]